MSEHGGEGGGDRPRWEGFPGGVEPGQYANGPGAPGYDAPGYAAPVPPQFPMDPGADATAPIPVVSSDSAADGAGPRSARHGHAAPRPGASRFVAISCAAAVVLIGGGFAFVACTGGNEVASTGSVPVALPVSTPTPSVPGAVVSPTATPSVGGSATGSATSSATASSSASASASSSATPSATASPSASPTQTVAAAKQPVVVLNSTAITGLAKRVAADITAEGWTVTKTTNWTGAAPSVTTIYYLPGAKNKASAKLFAKQFSVANAVRPALPGMTSNLTLVITRDAA